MAKKAKFNFLSEEDFFENDTIQEVETTTSAKESEAKAEESASAGAVENAKEESVKDVKKAEPEKTVAAEVEEDIMPAPEKVEEKPAEKTTEKTSTRKSTSKKKMDKDLKADFLQIDIRGMRDYLSTITSYEAMRTGDKVSFNTYIRSLIEKDMKKNAATYESFKRLFEDK